jgi:hypothetical protein
MTFASGARSFRIEGNTIGFVNASGGQLITQNSASTQEISNTFSFGSSQNSRFDLHAGDQLIPSADMYLDVTSAVARREPMMEEESLIRFPG